MNIQEVLARHKKWLENDEGGQRAYLQAADLRGADLRDADLDFSCWPLWCGSQSVKVNLRIVYQLLAHVACLECDEPEFQDIKKAIMPYALMSHRAADLDLIASERGQA